MRRDILGVACLSSLAFFRTSSADSSTEQDVAVDNSEVDRQDAPEGSPDPILGAVKLLGRNVSVIGWGVTWRPTLWYGRVFTSQKDTVKYAYREGEKIESGAEGVQAKRPDGSPRKVLLFSVPTKFQNNMAGFFPLIRGIPSSYIRSIRVVGAKKGGSVTKTASVSNSMQNARRTISKSHTYSYLLTAPKEYYQRNDSLVVFKRLSINDFLDGYDYIAVILMDGAASLSTSSISFEVWDRDPQK